MALHADHMYLEHKKQHTMIAECKQVMVRGGGEQGINTPPANQPLFAPYFCSENHPTLQLIMERHPG